ncbi:MAG: ABC transporter ATP-binding protein [Thiogranum sp.]|nr:ABC transporter ATP-binding protein [Thiogranum sp.]
MNSAIQIEGLGKKYLISHQQQDRYLSLRDEIMRGLHRAVDKLVHRKEEQLPSSGIEEFWALKDIDLAIEPGERIGIIGRNGAGKSTLLKVLSRITEPTEGQVRIRGRVASLLEVGTGFHPELTGRENIFLNGAILGMKREEIRRRFDEIVELAEIEKFLDTPVKRFSSGMYVRLAFAIAANLDSDILILDEVLAVGDQQFQSKCQGKMDEVGKQGRTIIFVSHNMGLIQKMTNRAILLVNGALAETGNTTDVVAAYFSDRKLSSQSTDLKTRSDRLFLNNITFCHEKLAAGFNRPLHFSLGISCNTVVDQVTFVLGIWNTVGARLVTTRCTLTLPQGEANVLDIALKNHHLPPGNYSLSVDISIATETIFSNDHVLFFELSDLEVTERYLIPFLKNHRDKIGTFVPADFNISAAIR